MSDVIKKGGPTYDGIDLRAREADRVVRLQARAETAEAERDELRERVARLEGAIKAAPHDANCISWRAVDALHTYRDVPSIHDCNCFKLTTLGDK